MASAEISTHAEKECFTILVVGGIGYGKSSFINSIVGEDKCKVGNTWIVGKTITEGIQEIKLNWENKDYKFVDTTSIPSLNSNPAFEKLYETGFHAIVIVCSIKSYATGSSRMFEELKNLLGVDMPRYSLVVLTFKDYLDESSVDEYVRANVKLMKFLEMLEEKDKRCLAFDNIIDKESREAEEQKKRFFACLDFVLKQNQNQTLTKEKQWYQKLCQCIRSSESHDTSIPDNL